MPGKPLIGVISLVVWVVLGGGVGADENTTHQRIATTEVLPVEAFLSGTIILQPDSATVYQQRTATITSGSTEIHLGARYRDVLDGTVSVQLPLAVLHEGNGQTTLRRTDDQTVGFSGGVNLGPPFRRYRVGVALDTARNIEGETQVALIRDPVIQTLGISVGTSMTKDRAYGVSFPMSIVLVPNDVTAFQLELVPAIRSVTTQPEASLSAVASVRWSWDRLSLSTASLFGEGGSPSGIAFTGGWLWKKKTSRS